jgi:hypothetical protein
MDNRGLIERTVVGETTIAVHKAAARFVATPYEVRISVRGGKAEVFFFDRQHAAVRFATEKAKAVRS